MIPVKNVRICCFSLVSGKLWFWIRLTTWSTYNEKNISCDKNVKKLFKIDASKNTDLLPFQVQPGLWTSLKGILTVSEGHTSPHFSLTPKWGWMSFLLPALVPPISKLVKADPSQTATMQPSSPSHTCKKTSTPKMWPSGVMMSCDKCCQLDCESLTQPRAANRTWPLSSHTPPAWGLTWTLRVCLVLTKTEETTKLREETSR